MDEGEDWEAIANKFKTMVKGDDPNDLKLKCILLCKQYLGGNWTQLNGDDIEIKRLTGGMMNMVYYCKIRDNMLADESELKEVAIRLYGNKFDFRTFEVTDNTLEENIKYAVLSQSGIGPEVYGLSKEGIIQKYYQHHHFIEKELYDRALLEQVAVKLARFHAMKVPIDKIRANTKDLMVSANKMVVKNLEELHKLFAKYNCKSLLDFDLKAETDWGLHKVKSFESPIVFSHNDFRFGNIMVTEDKQIIFGDFDSSDYYNRGFDFATFFTDFVKLDENSFGFKDESVVKYFIEKYLTESAIIKGKQYLDKEINSIEHILKEMKFFSLIFSLMIINNFLINEIWKFPLDEKTLLRTSDLEVDKYLKVKKFLDDF